MVCDRGVGPSSVPPGSSLPVPHVLDGGGGATAALLRLRWAVICLRLVAEQPPLGLGPLRLGLRQAVAAAMTPAVAAAGEILQRERRHGNASLGQALASARRLQPPGPLEVGQAAIDALVAGLPYAAASRRAMAARGVMRRRKQRRLGGLLGAAAVLALPAAAMGWRPAAASQRRPSLGGVGPLPEAEPEGAMDDPGPEPEADGGRFVVDEDEFGPIPDDHDKDDDDDDDEDDEDDDHDDDDDAEEDYFGPILKDDTILNSKAEAEGAKQLQQCVEDMAESDDEMDDQCSLGWRLAPPELDPEPEPEPEQEQEEAPETEPGPEPEPELEPEKELEELEEPLDLSVAEQLEEALNLAVAAAVAAAAASPAACAVGRTDTTDGEDGPMALPLVLPAPAAVAWLFGGWLVQGISAMAEPAATGGQQWRAGRARPSPPPPLQLLLAHADDQAKATVLVPAGPLANRGQMLPIYLRTGTAGGVGDSAATTELLDPRTGRRLAISGPGATLQAAAAVKEVVVSAGPTAVVLPPSGYYRWGSGGGGGGGGSGGDGGPGVELMTCPSGTSWLRLCGGRQPSGGSGYGHGAVLGAPQFGELAGGQGAHGAVGSAEEVEAQLLLSSDGSLGLVDGAGGEHLLWQAPAAGLSQRLAWAACWLDGRPSAAVAAAGRGSSPYALLSEDLLETIGLRLAAAADTASGKTAAGQLLWRVWRGSSWWPALQGRRRVSNGERGGLIEAGRREALRRMLAGDVTVPHNENELLLSDDELEALGLQADR